MICYIPRENFFSGQGVNISINSSKMRINRLRFVIMNIIYNGKESVVGSFTDSQFHSLFFEPRAFRLVWRVLIYV